MSSGPLGDNTDKRNPLHRPNPKPARVAGFSLLARGMRRLAPMAVRSPRTGESFPRGFGVVASRTDGNPGFDARRESPETPFSEPWCHARR